MSPRKQVKAEESAVPWWASDDPWVLSPEEQADLDERARKRREALAANPEPPF